MNERPDKTHIFLVLVIFFIGASNLTADPTWKELDAQADRCDENHDFVQAEKLHELSLQMVLKECGPDSLDTATEWCSCGWFWSNMASYPKAETAFDNCLRIRCKVLGAKCLLVADVLNAQGDVAENESNFSKAESLYKQAIEIDDAQTARADISPDLKKFVRLKLANHLNNLATLYWIFGEYERAEDNLDRALSIREDIWGLDSNSVADTLRNVALLDLDLGNSEEAERYFKQALAIRSEKLGPDNPLTVSIRSHLGQLYLRTKDTAKAEPLLVEAEATFEHIYGLNHPEVAQSLYYLGRLYDLEGKFDLAEPRYLQALAVWQAEGQDTSEYARCLAYLGQHDHMQGKLESALDFYQRALTIQEKVLGLHHPDTEKTAEWLAELDLDLGDQPSALTMAHQVVESKEAGVNEVFHFAPEDQRIDFEHGTEIWDLAATTGDANLIAQTVLRTKGIVLDSILEDHVLAQKEGAAEAVRLPDDTTGVAKERTQRVAWVEKVVGGETTRRSLAVQVTDIQQELPADAALLEYVGYNRYMGHLQTEPSFGVLVITRNFPPQWLPLGKSGEIIDAVHTFQHYVRKRVHETLLSGVLHNLEQTLVAPALARLPTGTDRLIICPDGELNFLSFSTLLDQRDRFLAESYGIEYVASGRDLLETSFPTTSPPAPLKGVVIVAQPDYNHRPSSPPVTDDEAFFGPLPGSGDEATFLAAEVQKRGWTATVLKGPEATEDKLRQIDPPYILHVASHAVFLGDDMARAWHLSATGTDVPEESMNRSFLALAGANNTIRDWQSGNTQEQEGMLSSKEVAQLNLRGTWLVTLSACDTGSGEALAGEGVLGLRRGFTEAGAHNLLLTLWPISDSETVVLMKTFYQRALTSGNAAAALAQAQREALVDLRQHQGLTAAVREAGPFILSY